MRYKKIMAALLTGTLLIQPAAIHATAETTAEEQAVVEGMADETEILDETGYSDVCENQIEDEEETAGIEIEEISEVIIQPQNAAADNPSITMVVSGGLVRVSGTGELTVHDWTEAMRIWTVSGENIKELLIDGEITELPEQMCKNFSKLEEVYIAAPVTGLKAEVFSGCVNLRTVELPEELESIGDNIFSGCTNLQNIVLPKNLKTMGSNVFSKCAMLHMIEFTGDAPTTTQATFSDLDRSSTSHDRVCITIPIQSEKNYESWKTKYNITIITKGTSDPVQRDHFSTDEATCQSQKRCDMCGEPFGELADHDYSDKWESDDTKHWKKCQTHGCDAIQSEQLHSGTRTSCQELAICTVCGENYGVIRDHVFSDWKADGDKHVRICQYSDCSETEEEDHTLIVTGYKEGDMNQHTVEMKCTKCDYTCEENLPHTFENAVCSKCGYEQHEYEYSYVSLDSKQHYVMQSCKHCKNSKITLENHELVQCEAAVAPTIVSEGKEVTYECRQCRTKVGGQIIPRITAVTLYKIPNKTYNLPDGKWKLTKTKAAKLKGNKLIVKKTGTIYLTDKNTLQAVVITIKKPTLSLNKKKLTLNVGDTFQLTADVFPETQMKYRSAKKKVAAVSADGLITAKKKGSTVITVIANGVKKKVKVRVN